MVLVERIGTVVEEKGETAVVRLRRHLSCENCGRCGGLLGAADRRDHYVEAANPIRARKGQSVIVEMDDRQALFIAFMLYLVPLAGLVAGIFLGFEIASAWDWEGAREPVAAGAGLLLMGLIFGLISLWDRRVKKSGRYRPVIAALAPEENPSAGTAD